MGKYSTSPDSKNCFKLDSISFIPNSGGSYWLPETVVVVIGLMIACGCVICVVALILVAVTYFLNNKKKVRGKSSDKYIKMSSTNSQEYDYDDYSTSF